MQRFRYRPGVVGELQRVVHVRAGGRADGALRSLCGRGFLAAEVEGVDAVAGMPCMSCVALAAQLSGSGAAESAVRTPPGLGGELEGGGPGA
ncbi:hypothetical protein GCM10027174_17170 [Salinifilum aidingensis]